MLTKDLIRYKTVDERIIPEFIDPDDPDLLSAAEQLLAVFSEGAGNTRSELLENSRPIIQNSPCPAIVVRGLEKLLLDRTEFDTDPDEELLKFRQTVFTQTSRWLSTESFADFDAYQQRVQGEFQTPPAELADKLYADLPDYQQVLSFKTTSAKSLLHRYNCAQVQGLLIHCDTLDLTVTDSGTAQLRQLFKYLRFHQLLATIRKEADERFRIAVDGPLNLFYQTKRYGLNLANFFLAVLHQQRWELAALIRFKDKSYHLRLDESCGILPDSPNFLAYIPDDIQLFQNIFEKKAEGWRIAPGSHFVPLEGDFYCFPDYTLVHASGTEIALELFHPWHASHFLARLQRLTDAEMPPLILGISNILLKNPLVAETIEKSDYFARFGFVFRKIPTMNKAGPVLERVLESS